MGAIERKTKTTVAVVRALLTLPEVERHGFGIALASKCKAGTVYKILDRLMEDGWLTFRWEPNPNEKNPPRKVFSFTEKGGREAAVFLRSLDPAEFPTPAPKPEQSHPLPAGGTA
ncbi:PadR family transcriptional regulator [Streptomyces sp. MS2.AVA.5]|uniref:PadR family transcriptional regulator n=1 Tax=Streptomyces achmelvichensis TaxID=3134111 RepID=A0ACC6PYV0_9ACTN